MPGAALVTGASAGIGAAVARRLLADGWRVTGLDQTAPTIEAAGFAALRANLEEPAAWAALQGLGDITALVHAAGGLRVAHLGELRPEDGDAMWRIHVAAAERLANLLAPRIAEGGRIVLIGSRLSRGAAGRSQYAAVKAALVGMARSWAIELASRGVTVNVVSPAATATAMLVDPARAAAPPKMPPIGRYIRPDEVAATVAFLLSPDAGAITGQEIAICGGASL